MEFFISNSVTWARIVSTKLNYPVNAKVSGSFDLRYSVKSSLHSVAFVSVIELKYIFHTAAILHRQYYVYDFNIVQSWYKCYYVRVVYTVREHTNNTQNTIVYRARLRKLSGTRRIRIQYTLGTYCSAFVKRCRGRRRHYTMAL